ncbi:LPXTG cell wall anchor domain-containing protein [Streptomyces sp. NPDC002742]
MPDTGAGSSLPWFAAAAAVALAAGATLFTAVRRRKAH